MTNNDTLDKLGSKAKTLATRIDRGQVFLNKLGAQAGQDSPEFLQYFAEWERLLDEERRTLEALELAQTNAALRARLIEANRVDTRLHDSSHAYALA